jgi:hypothetical protein
MSKPLIQIDDLVREMTDEEIEQQLQQPEFKLKGTDETSSPD